uniref:ATP synthase F0 subunit 8 n=1 Tax=Euseius nicholsi TaxID=702746 RepID=A0A0U1ZAT9_9ACAR|nr:ATP synthase F0 subunit 8 [Euseius nicholsi]
MTLMPQMKPMNWMIIFIFSYIIHFLLLLNFSQKMSKNYKNIINLKMNNLMKLNFKKW